MKIIAVVIVTLLFCAVSHAAEAPLDVKQSFLKFTGHAFLHDFDGEAQQFSGSAQVDAKNPSLVVSAQIDIQAAKMTTFESTRDQHMFEWLHVDANPGITFRLTKLTAIKGDLTTATKDHPVQFAVEGDFTLNKTTKPLKALVTGWREGKTLVATGTTQIDTAEHGLPEVRTLFLTVSKQVDIAFHLVFDLPYNL
jgi:polyisoprenoid-binding protein YceI